MKPGEDLLFQLNEVSYTYTAVHTPSYKALKSVNLQIGRGEFVAIIGPSGSGKSTLMHLLGIMADPSEGQLLIHGQDIALLSTNQKAELRNRSIGFLFQQFFLLPQLSVLENILLPGEYGAAAQGEDELRARAFQLIQRFGLSGQEDKKPANLSGGQRQRVALCRALIMNPDILMCDEPTGALDSATAQEVLNTLAELHREGRTIIVITHDPEVAQKAGRIIRIVDGKIISDDVNDPTEMQLIRATSASTPTRATPSATNKRGIISRINRGLRYMFVPTLQALRSQKLRTALTMTGLLLGVASVFIMLTLTGRVSSIFEEFFATQGSRKAFVSFDGRMADRTGAPRWRGLNINNDLPRLNAQLSTYGRLDANIDASGCKVIAGSANIEGSLVGVNSLLEARENDLRVAHGRLPMPNEFDRRMVARVALLGSDAAVKLFPAKNDSTSVSPVGQHLIIRGCEFEGILTVIGVLQPIDSLFDNGINSSIYVPSQTLVAGGASVYKSRFTAVPHDGVSPTWFAKHVIGKLTVHTGNQFPFRYFAAEQELEKFNLMMGILTGLTLVIGALCTIIGGIGVMNIMLVSVHERIQEIGIRKAVGAKNAHIRRQFLLESTGLCLLSGALGLLVGLAVSIAAFAIARMFLPRVENLSYQLDLTAVITSLAVSLGAGLLFGTWPARRAAALDVVDALKQE